MASREIDRRSVLRGGAAGLVAAGLPGCKDEPAAAAVAAGAIDHVVVVMMENRSFDHYLGALTLEEGRAEVDGLTGAEVNADSAGTPYSPAHLEETCQRDPPHSWSASHTQFDEGENDGFVLTYEASTGLTGGVMGYYSRADLPTHYTLSDHFCVPDRYFCSVMSSTWPNRLFGQTGSSKGQTSNDLPLDGYDQLSIYQALAEAGQEWRYWYTDMPFIGLLTDHWDEDRIGVIEDFFDDAAAGELPALTWIDPGFSYNDDHPPHHIKLGQLFLAMVYEAIASSPAWERTLLVITYDEHGGFFDHVPPPTVADDLAEEGFDQLGFRVPTLLVGPWVRQGVDTTVYDHTSTLKFICERFGIEPWNARIAGANSLASCLDADRMAAGEPLSAPSIAPFDVPELDALAEECLSSAVSGQPELEDWVTKHRPSADRRGQLAAIHGRLMARARRMGLLADGGAPRQA